MAIPQEVVMNKLASYLLWPAIGVIGAFAFAAIALKRGESVSAVWLVTAALADSPRFKAIAANAKAPMTPMAGQRR
jgi:hypothetical protein